jgi:hypothetical protein
MTRSVRELRDRLFSASDGRSAFDAAAALLAGMKDGDREARRILFEYVVDGTYAHLREHITAQIAELAPEQDAEARAFFLRGLAIPAAQYWSVLGLIRAAGSDAYPDLVRIAADEAVDMETRAHAVKRLALHSRQLFDRAIDTDRNFKLKQLLLDEVLAWQDAGYPRGPGHPQPARDPALDAPQSRLECLVAALDRKLATLREAGDPAFPSDYLTPAVPEDLERVIAQWTLPSVYREFLARFSPLGVCLVEERYTSGLHLYGASELIEAQFGYSVHPDTGEFLAGWPAGLLVIAADNADPFALDLGASDGQDAPVLSAMHGMGRWDFDEAASSFEEFLTDIAYEDSST